MDKYVTCPYYKRIEKDKNHIVCEGVDGASSARMVFSSPKECEEYMRERCTSNYCLCVICRGIHEYYEGD
ncbi:MAG: hypothetical protein K6F11_08185 [Lachnospiraceae bacterium]|nr:hypothetical protein [Lachnospiraceae bacterium]